MVRKVSGDLHFYINGLDQGIAATNVPACVWGVVDLYGMTVKASINMFFLQDIFDKCRVLFGLYFLIIRACMSNLPRVN